MSKSVKTGMQLSSQHFDMVDTDPGTEPSLTSPVQSPINNQLLSNDLLLNTSLPAAGDSVQSYLLLPIFLGLFPYFLSSLFGGEKFWMEFSFLALVLFWLYLNSTVPWNIYSICVFKRQQELTSLKDPNKFSIWQVLEIISIAGLFLTPFIAAYGVLYFQTYYAEKHGIRLLTSFNIHLFVLAGLIIPLRYFFGVGYPTKITRESAFAFTPREGASILPLPPTYPTSPKQIDPKVAELNTQSSFDVLNKRVSLLEKEIRTLQSIIISFRSVQKSKSETNGMEDSILPAGKQSSLKGFFKSTSSIENKAEVINLKHSVLPNEETSSFDELEIVFLPSKNKRKVVESDGSDNEVAIFLDKGLSNGPIMNTKSSTVDMLQYKNTSSLSMAYIDQSFPSTNELNITNFEGEDFKPTEVDVEKNSEERYSFLVNILDAEKRPPSDPNYDNRTLYIPSSFYSKFTPFEKQYWDIKKKFFDTIVFFKKGKFFELYENDADIAALRFDLKVTDRVNMKMAGVPEATLEQWTQKFVEAGYKVAIVKQLENQLGREIRKKSEVSANKARKSTEDTSLIRREVACVITSATITDPLMMQSDFSSFVMVIYAQNCTTFGIIFVDVSTSYLQYCKFDDDVRQYYLETLLVQTKPKEILVEKNASYTNQVSSLIRKLLPTSTTIPLAPEKEFYSNARCLDELDKLGYFKVIRSDNHLSSAYPDNFEHILSDPLLGSAFGALLYYFQYLHIDQMVIPSLKFVPYDLFPKAQSSSLGQISAIETPILGLDGTSILNLEIFQNSIDGSSASTLFEAMDHCLTPMGRRRLRNWLSHPLTSVSMITGRQNSIRLFCKQGSSLDKFVASYLKGMPDIERLLSRASTKQSRLKEFVTLLDSLALSISFIENLKTQFEKQQSVSKGQEAPFYATGNTTMLELIYASDLDLEEFEAILNTHRNAFDRKAALEHGELKLNPGKHNDPAYTEIEERISKIIKSLESYSSKMKKELQCPEIRFRDIGQAIYQLELPLKHCTNLPCEFLLMSKTKSVQRYWTPFIKEQVKELELAREMRSSFLSNLLNSFLELFNRHSGHWQKICRTISEIDCFYSMFLFKEYRLGSLNTIPELSESTHSYLHAVQLGMYDRNTTGYFRFVTTFRSSAGSFIPNDVYLGGAVDHIYHPEAIILTGPNMGGKSTLLRQIAICVILAQMGSFVPASSVRMSIFDRIFTRIGAQDNILAGKSTFKVELEETSRILNEATPFSLVILDELGRGTSTLDGHSVAFAVFHNLVARIGCISLFSTHYRELTEEFYSVFSSEQRTLTPRPIGLWHMDCIVDKDSKEVVFLYKLSIGVCPQSYGMNVARLAGIPEKVIERAMALSVKFEKKRQNEISIQTDKENLYHCKIPSYLPFDLKQVCQAKENKNERYVLRINLFYQ